MDSWGWGPYGDGKSGKGGMGDWGNNFWGPSPWDWMDGGWFKGDWGKGGKKAPKKQVEHAGPSGPPPTADSPKVFVGALPPQVSEDSVRGYFSQFGEIQDMKLMYHDNGIFKGYAFVTFGDVETAQKVYDNYANNIIDDKWVDCKPAADGGRTNGGGEGSKGSKGWSNGPIKPGDWICPNCGDLVFSWRSSCNMCGFPGKGGSKGYKGW